MKRFAIACFTSISIAAADDAADALVGAAYRDDLAVVKELVSNGTPPDMANAFGANALAMSCTNGNSEMLRYLLDAGASAKSTSNQEPVIVTAARAGHADCVRILLERGADANDAGNRKQTALMWAAAGGHKEAVALLLRHGAKPNEQLNSGFDAMMFAVRAGHLAVVKQLAEAGVSAIEPRSPDKTNGRSMEPGTTPLILAIENGHFELASVLLSMGADPNDQRTGFAPLHVLTWVRKSERGDGPNGVPPPRGSGSIGSLELVRRLIKAGADVNLQLEDGRAGADQLNPKGATPFLLAAKSCDLDYLKLLRELGANPRLNNADDTTPLLTACGIGVNAPGEEQAMEEDSLAVIPFLLELGLDINHVDKRGDTVMHAAAYKSSPAILQLLDQRGADIRIWHKKNRKGWTPLLIAQGFRPGNFRPIQYTVDALSAIMRRRGIEPEPSPPAPGLNAAETPYSP